MTTALVIIVGVILLLDAAFFAFMIRRGRLKAQLRENAGRNGVDRLGGVSHVDFSRKSGARNNG